MQTSIGKKYILLGFSSGALVIGAGVYMFKKISNFNNQLMLDNESYLYSQPTSVDVDLLENQFRKCLYYLKMSKSKNFYLKNYAIHKLASLKNLSDHQMYKLAFRIDYETSIGLARQKSIDFRLFPPPINSHLRKDDTFEILKILDQELLSQLNSRYYASLAFKARKRWKMMYSKLNEEVREKYFSQKRCHVLCLQAFLRFSAYNKEACEIMINSGLLASLHSIKEMYHNDFEIESMIAKLLANISQYQELKKDFFKTGWIGILSQWMREKRLELSLNATKILYNLENDHFLLSDNVFILHPSFKGEKCHYDLVFIHGLMGSVFKTWRQSDSKIFNSEHTKCWPRDWLPKDIKWLRILAIDYHTQLTNWEYDFFPEKSTLQEKIESIMQQLVKAGLGKRPLVLIGHSMGGIFIKHMLVKCSESSNLDYQNILKQTRGVVFYSVPHRGSEMTTWPIKFQKVLLPSEEIQHLMKDSPFLLDLHNKFVKLAIAKNIECLSLAETDKSKIGLKNVKWKAKLVTQESADPNIGSFYLLNADHFSSCKPEDLNAPSYSLVKNFVDRVLKKAKICKTSGK